MSSTANATVNRPSWLVFNNKQTAAAAADDDDDDDDGGGHKMKLTF